MPLRIGLVTCAHLHVLSYVHALKSRAEADIVGIWDHEEARGQAFAQQQGIAYFATYEALLAACDAVVIASENNLHAEHGIRAAEAGKHVLCEKPLVTKFEDGVAFIDACRKADVRLMTAFPCRFSPAWGTLKEKVAMGEIGRLRAITATNRGTCPFGWFVQPALSGGGAMIDHVVHVADLLRDLLVDEPISVQAQIGNNVYSQEWEDTAMLTLQYRDGIFATLDSSWSRPKSFKTWGDVTMNVVGDEGVIELDMFGQHIQRYSSGDPSHTVGWYGSDLDGLMIDEFIASCLEGRDPLVTGEHGLAAAKVALAGYRSVVDAQPASL